MFPSPQTSEMALVYWSVHQDLNLPATHLISSSLPTLHNISFYN